MESAPEQPRRGADIIPLPIRESVDAELTRLEREVVGALKRLIDANSKDEPASARVFAIGAKLNGAQSDEEKRELTAQLDAANQQRHEVWDEIREAHERHEEAKAAYEEEKERLETGELEGGSVEHRKAA